MFTEYLVYQTQIDRLDITQTKSYYGTCQKSLKECHLNHPASFGNKSTEKSAEFSKYVWELKIVAYIMTLSELQLARPNHTHLVSENVTYV